MNALERFMSHTRPDPSGCVLWTGCLDSLGYGSFRIGGRGATQHRAHHAGWLLMAGPIPSGLIVRHRCDNPPCVAFDHLVLGTHADNRADCVARERQARGSKHGLARLREDQVEAIRALSAAGLTQRTIANQFGVSRGAVQSIVYGKTWGWL